MASQPKPPANKSPRQERFGFWCIYIDVSGDWNCVASKDRAGLSDRNKYKAKDGPPFALLFNIIEKIKQATSSTPNAPDILVSLKPDPKGGDIIVMDEDKPASRTPVRAVRTAASSTKKHDHNKKLPPSTAKKPAALKAKEDEAIDDTSTRGQRKHDKSKPRKSKPRKSKGSK
ncbi:MAG TPA: hypothetical protein VKA15_13365 [Isosphaeraceae bacterium]|nr:hypothetical protein [Isosphaeraceae bacterium]